MKNHKVHGVISIMLTFIALTIGTITLFTNSLVMGLFYILIIPQCAFIIVYAYCSKCPCRFNNCAHILPGKLALILPKRKSTEYSRADVIAVFLSLILLLAIPQYWLIKDIARFVIFWGLMTIAFFQVNLFVCKGCSNHKCFVKKRSIKAQ